MLVTTKGQVTIPKHIRDAAGVGPGSQVSFRLDGSNIVISPTSTRSKTDRRAQLRAAASKARASFAPEFHQLDAEAIMLFLRSK